MDDAFAAANRQALALAEQRIAEVPGVRAVYGPARLLDITADARGNTGARPVLARGRGASQTAAGESSESEGEAARQRVVRRADALGWFLTENGRRVRFYIDTDSWSPVASAWSSPWRPRVAVWRPRRRAGWRRDRSCPTRACAGGWLPARVRGGVGVPRAGGVAAFARPPGTARLAAPGTGACGRGRRRRAVRVRAGHRRADHRRARGAGRPAHRVRDLAAALPAPADAPAGRPRVAVRDRCGCGRRGGAVPSLRVGTRQWGASPMFFVSVRGELDEPVVLREVRRLRRLRDQPASRTRGPSPISSRASRWKATRPAGSPTNSEQVRRILVQARTDPAVRLELPGDHREALIADRFDGDPTVDHLTIVARLERYLAVELRRALMRVNLRAAGVSPLTRSLGRGVLANDARERVLRICTRSGRPLDVTEAMAVERVARQAATIPAADLGRLDADVADAVRDFIARYPFALGPAATTRLIAAVGALGDGASIDDVRVAVATAYGGRLSDAILRTTAENLARRIASVRRRHVAANQLPGHALRCAVAQRGRARRRGARRDAGRDGADRGYSGRGRQSDGLPPGHGARGGAPNDRALSLRSRGGRSPPAPSRRRA